MNILHVLMQYVLIYFRIRVQLLEVDQKRSARVSDAPTNAATAPSVADLQAEVGRFSVRYTYASDDDV